MERLIFSMSLGYFVSQLILSRADLPLGLERLPSPKRETSDVC